MADTRKIVPVGQFTTVTWDGRQIVDVKSLLSSPKVKRALDSIRESRMKFAFPIPVSEK